jgi:anti-sigma factor RsiW
VTDGSRIDAELAQLLDGSLEPARAAELEAAFGDRILRMRAGRDLAREAAASVEAPFELRRRVDALGVVAPRWPGRAPRRLLRWQPLAALAGVAAAALIALVLATGTGAPTVTAVLDAAGGAPAAAISPAGGPLLPVEVEGVRFPDYAEKFGWRAVGQRTDEVDGRSVTTVTYARGDERVRYSIVAGDALEQPDGADIEAEGTLVRRIGDANAVTWERQGHTCVMEGSVPVGTLAELAGWKAKGEVPF